jgi:hypothetical protein
MIASAALTSAALTSSLARLRRPRLCINSLRFPRSSLFLRCSLDHNLSRLARNRRLSLLLASDTASPAPAPATAPAAAAIGTRSALANLFALALARRHIQNFLVRRREAPELFNRALHAGLRLHLWLRLAAAPFAIPSLAAATPTSLAAALAAALNSALTRDLTRDLSFGPLAARSTCFAASGAAKVRNLAGLFHEVGDVEECIAFEPNVHKARLHTRQNARHASVVDRAGERVLVLALVINLCEFFFFDNR